MNKKENRITEKDLEEYRSYLISKGHTERTVEKYVYDADFFSKFLKDRKITPKILDDFKNKRLKNYTAIGARSVIYNTNKYLSYIDCPHRIENIKPSEKKRDLSKTAITKEEYLEVLKAIKRSGKDRLYLIAESIGSAGLKLSEVQYLTVEAVIKGKVDLPMNHGSIYLPKNLCSDLLEYCKDNNIFIGTILVTANGTVPDKGNVSKELKSICADAGIDPERISTKALRDYYLKSFEDYRNEIVEMMDREWREPRKCV